MVTLKDIAKAAGISITQVSRALNNYSDVNIKTKEKVQKIAIELGYVKNIIAQRLATSTSNQIGYLVVGLEDDRNSNEYSAVYPITRGINDFILNTDYELAVYFFKKIHMSYLQFAKNKGLAGIIISGIEYDDPNLSELLKSDFPCVLIDIPVQNHKKKGCVIINNSFQTSSCIEKLIEIGRKNIIMISGHLHATVSLERELGFKTTMIMHHLPFDESMIFRADFDEKMAQRITYDIIEKYPDVNGIFCASDFMAIGCMKALTDIGKKIPEDIAIIGFDGIPQAEYTTPTLTTVVQDNYKNGYSSAQLLHDFLTNTPTTTNTITLDCKLIERQSTNI